jgi:hypothetical protein
MRTGIAAVVGLCFLFAGCGGVPSARPKVYPVTGKVTQKGKPLTAGEVMFTPSGGPDGASGHIATGQIDSDGSYTLTTFNTGDGAVLGKHKVTVVSRSSDNLEKMNKLKGGAIAYKLPPSLVSSKYSQVGTTPLTYTVEDGSNTINIDLKE